MNETASRRLTPWLLGVAGALALLGFAACSDSLHLDPSGSGGGHAGPATSSVGSGGTGGGDAGAPVACVSNSDCPAPTSICDTVKNLCVECLTHDDCAFEPGTVCSKGTCACPTDGETFCEATPGTQARCVDLTTSPSDCGTCGHACYGACTEGKCADAWEPTAVAGAPSARDRHVAVWTGSTMIVWGGDAGGSTNTGGVYDPATGKWTATSTANAPSPRADATAVWTGSKMIVWGGRAGAPVGTGGIFDPKTNTWSAMSTSGAPSARYQHTAVWTGSKMIVWGGFDGSSPLGDGAVYDPASDAWSAVPGGPQARRMHTAVWTGTKMLVYGGLGYDAVNSVNVALGDGSLYDPLNGTWSAINGNGAPGARYSHAAVWSGTDMIVWGGNDTNNALQDGAKYSLAQDAWTLMNGPFPDARTSPVAVWLATTKKMAMFGGDAGGPLGSGGLYDPSSNTWSSMPTAPAPRRYHTGVSTDTKLIVWGGDASGLTNTGGVFDSKF